MKNVRERALVACKIIQKKFYDNYFVKFLCKNIVFSIGFRIVMRNKTGLYTNGFTQVKPLVYMFVLEIGIVGSTRERYDISDVCHTGHEQQQSFQPHAESCMRACTIASGV